MTCTYIDGSDLDQHEYAIEKSENANSSLLGIVLAPFQKVARLYRSRQTVWELYGMDEVHLKDKGFERHDLSMVLSRPLWVDPVEELGRIAIRRRQATKWANLFGRKIVRK